MAYYFCTIREQLGEYEFDSNFVMESEDIEKDFDARCANWRGEGELDDALGGYWFDGIFLSTGEAYYVEITKEEVEVLKKHIAAL